MKEFTKVANDNLKDSEFHEVKELMPFKGSAPKIISKCSKKLEARPKRNLAVSLNITGEAKSTDLLVSRQTTYFNDDDVPPLESI